MDYYLVSTYHGPIIYIDSHTSWAIAAPGRPTERYDGSLPERCLANARPIPASEAHQILSPNEPADGTNGPFRDSVINSLALARST